MQALFEKGQAPLWLSLCRGEGIASELSAVSVTCFRALIEEDVLGRAHRRFCCSRILLTSRASGCGQV